MEVAFAVATYYSLLELNSILGHVTIAYQIAEETMVSIIDIVVSIMTLAKQLLY